MKKQELIHLHGLLAEVKSYHEQHDREDVDLTEYNELGVRPTSIHKSKTDHKAAVFSLASSITDSMSGEVEKTETIAAQAD